MDTDPLYSCPSDVECERPIAVLTSTPEFWLGHVIGGCPVSLSSMQVSILASLHASLEGFAWISTFLSKQNRQK